MHRKNSDNVKCYRLKIKAHCDTGQHCADSRVPLQIRDWANSSSCAVPVRHVCMISFTVTAVNHVVSVLPDPSL